MKMTNKRISAKAQSAPTPSVRKAGDRKSKAATQPIQTQLAQSQAVEAPLATPIAVRTAGGAKTAAPSISLELLKPDANQVFVAGSFNGWKPETTPLQRSEGGRWIGNLTVNPGKYEYLFVVDGQWMPDPNAKETVQNPFGGKNSVLSVSA